MVARSVARLTLTWATPGTRPSAAFKLATQLAHDMPPTPMSTVPCRMESLLCSDPAILCHKITYLAMFCLAEERRGLRPRGTQRAMRTKNSLGALAKRYGADKVQAGKDMIGRLLTGKIR